MMIEVACFCGRLYSSDGDFGVCPKCGEDAFMPSHRTLSGRAALPVETAGSNGNQHLTLRYDLRLEPLTHVTQ